MQQHPAGQLYLASRDSGGCNQEGQQTVQQGMHSISEEIYCASAIHLCSAIEKVDQSQQAAEAMPDFAAHLTAAQEWKGCLGLDQLALHTHQACQAWNHGRWAISVWRTAHFMLYRQGCRAAHIAAPQNCKHIIAVLQVS